MLSAFYNIYARLFGNIFYRRYFKIISNLRINYLGKFYLIKWLFWIKNWKTLRFLNRNLCLIKCFLVFKRFIFILDYKNHWNKYMSSIKNLIENIFNVDIFNSVKTSVKIYVSINFFNYHKISYKTLYI